ncbi:serine/arginine repetitive matrix protein 1-like [Bolinopsis microptera]|uniref:serine/arginine repetitive matrix protein 1-like n=1 Tax=Bolinopsis microptera TaxID=2820187 RepID=UPI00307A078B
MEHGSNNQEAISVHCLDPLAEDVVSMRSKSAEPLGRAKSPSSSKSHRTKRYSAAERPKFHFHDRQNSEDKKDRRRRHSSSSRKKEITTDAPVHKGFKTPDPIKENEAECKQDSHKSSQSEELLENEKDKMNNLTPEKDRRRRHSSSSRKKESTIDSPFHKEPKTPDPIIENEAERKQDLNSEESVNEKQHEQEVTNVKLEKPLTLSAVHEDSPPRTTEIKPEIIKFKKVSKFVEVSPNVRKNDHKNEIVRSSKPAKFVVLQHKQNEPDSKKEPSKKDSKKKEKKASKSKKVKKRRKRKSSSSSLSSYSYSDSESSILPSMKKSVSKLALCEVPESSNRPPHGPPPPPRPPRSDQTMDSHVYENYPIHKNGSNAPATLTAEIIETPIIIPSPLKRKNSDLRVPPSPSHSPLLRRKESVELQKKSPEKESMNPQFKLSPTKQKKSKNDAKLDRRVSVAASIFGDVVKRRPPTHRHVDNRPKNPLEEIKTKNFSLKRTFEGGAINLEKPVPGLGRVLGEVTVIKPPRPLNRRQSAPPGYLSIRPEPPEEANILGQISGGIKLRSVPKPVESRIGLGRVIEDSTPDDNNDLPSIPSGKQNNYSRLLSDIKEIGDQIEEVFDDVVDKVVSKAQTPPPPPRPPPTSNKKPGISKDTDHLGVPKALHAEKNLKTFGISPALRPKLTLSAVSTLDIPPATPSPDEKEPDSVFPGYQSSLRSKETVSYATKTAAILTPSPIQSPSQFVDDIPENISDNLQSYEEAACNVLHFLVPLYGAFYNGLVDYIPYNIPYN